MITLYEVFGVPGVQKDWALKRVHLCWCIGAVIRSDALHEPALKPPPRPNLTQLGLNKSPFSFVRDIDDTHELLENLNRSLAAMQSLLDIGC